MRGIGLAAVIVIAVLVFAGAARAGELYYYLDENGVYHFCDQRKSYRYDKMLIWRDGDYQARKVVLSDKYTSIIEAACRQYEVEPALIKSMVRAESDYNRYAISRAGAQGLMQLMPETAHKFRLTDPFNPRDNIFAGVALMKILLLKYKDNLDLALAAYNAGETAVAKYGGVPPYHETRTYIKRVHKYRREYLEKERPDLYKQSSSKAPK
jgi:soluble lytic murein transglycosylase-like protein